jgi:hypothetical protein
MEINKRPIFIVKRLSGAVRLVKMSAERSVADATEEICDRATEGNKIVEVHAALSKAAQL